MKYFESIEQFTKFTAVFSVIIISLGFASLVIYYEYFGIDVFEYLVISEIITTAFSFLLVLFVPILVSIYLVKDINDFIGARPKLRKPLFHYRFTYFMLVTWIITIAGLFYKVEIAKYELLNRTLELFFLVFIFSSLFMPFLFVFEKASTGTTVRSFWIAGILAFVFLLIVLSLKIKRVSNNKSGKTSTFYLANDSTITTNDSIKFLGKTQGYYFLWNKNSNTSTIYPASEIKKIDIKP